jgi:hypothetical protein
MHMCMKVKDRVKTICDLSKNNACSNYILI